MRLVSEIGYNKTTRAVLNRLKGLISADAGSLKISSSLSGTTWNIWLADDRKGVRLKKKES